MGGNDNGEVYLCEGCGGEAAKVLRCGVATVRAAEANSDVFSLDVGFGVPGAGVRKPTSMRVARFPQVDAVGATIEQTREVLANQIAYIWFGSQATTVGFFQPT